jgi:hypothetical protein
MNPKALHFRKLSGSTSLEGTLRKAIKALAFYNIPHFVCGGFAVQEHGYARFTGDVDLIVPNIAEAREKLLISGFKENPGSSMTVTDRRTKAEVDLLPGGGKAGPGPLNLPMPKIVSEEPQILTLEKLLETKLSSYTGTPTGRARDLGDVVELIKINSLPREFPVDAKVKATYEQIWDKLAAESLMGGSE